MVPISSHKICSSDSKVLHRWLLVGCDCGFIKHVPCHAFALDWTGSSSVIITSPNNDIFIIPFAVILFDQFIIVTSDDHGYVGGGTIRNFCVILIDQFMEIM